ncbi:hypothetical protein O6H91_11G057300 [Diphasiastrum complanatum]|uniref:Uncharacterized protein n=1 Tax=Diphasiastrum complanatum TaxID=34168 RepID=A0ACC2C9T5_DIPCM|nr:hypothetical protein O6H91_11G057300 [Diphasiastrum complanatum]
MAGNWRSGCDASILINSTKTNLAEKAAGSNFQLRGFDLIDAAKAAVEHACPGIVSCADIVAIAARDAVVLAKGSRWEVPTGRRDGRISLQSDADKMLLQTSDSSEVGIAAFAARGLSKQDFVALLGSHTIGNARCGFFEDRLYNFQNSGKPDPTMNPNLVKLLTNTCLKNFTDPTTPLDQGTPFIFDSNYYKELLMRNGILRIDEEISTDPNLFGFVKKFATSSLDFDASFVAAMINLGKVGIKTGSQGEIRLSCSVINS